MFPKAESFHKQVCEDAAQCDGDGDENSQDAGVHIGLVLPFQPFSPALIGSGFWLQFSGWFMLR